MADQPVPAPSERVTLRRGVARGEYDPEVVRSILDDGLVAHVGVDKPDGPVVLPMAYGRLDDTLYLHGATANALLRSGAGAQLCITVTLVDGLVFARSPFHNSMNYRCVVVRGEGRRVDDDTERRAALACITDHVVANWDHGRPVSDAELRRTLVVAVSIDEASAKVRSGDPVDDAGDLDGPHWAGTVELHRRFGTPTPAADLTSGIAAPAPIAERFGN